MLMDSLISLDVLRRMLSFSLLSPMSRLQRMSNHAKGEADPWNRDAHVLLRLLSVNKSVSFTTVNRGSISKFTAEFYSVYFDIV